MIQEKQSILIIVSRLLGYPDESFTELKKDIESFIDESIESPELRENLKANCELLGQLPFKELQELYVETFDLKSKLGLYLTAHELGDSNRRGAALIKLQKIVNQAGFERVGEELADYIPMLLEFLAVTEETPETERLFHRLSVVISYMYDHIGDDNAYKGIFQMLVEHVFPAPSDEEKKQLEAGREEADLEELPYPIMYQ
ncbi:nitrate reductase molybdenum cofactor assembly chaperone [Virgibacillus sp. MSP4-1]|uniref:nitrate reductase molybdenum cofactor assembly chaperone n=1 Tax=Virgibacillus sp. MSP4-1 TaxID=2700081 RepID=UPI0003A3D2BF|nr:nitrate reductase molybdenum cofactor assembly chaperone [Virgibacillus sp. MSP4-1]QHS21450.1 nitrate reductase molybdenum cofactor assembly chaperone [Virgibacillus sp. MSP4-1]